MQFNKCVIVKLCCGGHLFSILVSKSSISEAQLLVITNSVVLTALVRLLGRLVENFTLRT